MPKSLNELLRHWRSGLFTFWSNDQYPGMAQRVVDFLAMTNYIMIWHLLSYLPTLMTRGVGKRWSMMYVDIVRDLCSMTQKQ